MNLDSCEITFKYIFFFACSSPASSRTRCLKKASITTISKKEEFDSTHTHTYRLISSQIKKLKPQKLKAIDKTSKLKLKLQLSIAIPRNSTVYTPKRGNIKGTSLK